jgi:micrococcal nuclease
MKSSDIFRLIPRKYHLHLVVALLLVGFYTALSSDAPQTKGAETAITPSLTSVPQSNTQNSAPQRGTLSDTPPVATAEGETATVVAVIDGDTIQIDTGQRVRYIGIDTPELRQQECFAQEAMERNKELVMGQTVRLVKDVSETDRYGRLLRYVFVNERFINQLLVAEGFANASSYPPDIAYQQVFRSAEDLAREQGAGLWTQCP